MSEYPNGGPHSIAEMAERTKQEKTCLCGHQRSDHIYEEGACRPGYPCNCQTFTAARKRAPTRAVNPFVETLAKAVIKLTDFDLRDPMQLILVNIHIANVAAFAKLCLKEEERLDRESFYENREFKD